MLEKVCFIFSYILLPFIAVVLYKFITKKIDINKDIDLKYNLIKGLVYLLNIYVLTVSFLTNSDLQIYIAGTTISISIFEGLPFVLDYFIK